MKDWDINMEIQIKLAIDMDLDSHDRLIELANAEDLSDASYMEREIRRMIKRWKTETLQKPKKKTSRLTEAILETAEDMRKDGLLKEKAYEKITKRHLKGEPETLKMPKKKTKRKK